ncbi:MAG TPA: hypothetical protein PKC48_13445 [Sphingorhabdus sp.]|jgi:hypothetical protein|uniref:hypothetical protein n=1 Tax=Sphingorhabdus sp. TaxID=1902408 RepID=UPI002C177818|nr:hypothetical protein [Sphingorhabdus sp.]HMT41743.1 hypothetical protein [Sphingorhabdus sp.]HMU23297.1 hypothetical protein [Sphingorhabdus sp.]
MVAFEELLRPTTLLDLIGPRVGRLSGLQGAHLIGEKFWLDNLGFLDDLGFGIGRNAIANGSLAPETGRGGYALGVSVHSGQQRGSFDRLQFSTSNLGGPKFLNQIREKLIAAETAFADDPIGV